jgi:chemotaxis protein methyltransferase CheR
MLRARSGLLLTRDKGYLVENRLAPVLREHGYTSVTDFIEAHKGGNAPLQAAVIDPMLPKDTGFFREWKPSAHFQTVVLRNIARAD